MPRFRHLGTGASPSYLIAHAETLGISDRVVELMGRRDHPKRLENFPAHRSSVRPVLAAAQQEELPSSRSVQDPETAVPDDRRGPGRPPGPATNAPTRWRVGMCSATAID